MADMIVLQMVRIVFHIWHSENREFFSDLSVCKTRYIGKLWANFCGFFGCLQLREELNNCY